MTITWRKILVVNLKKHFKYVLGVFSSSLHIIPSPGPSQQSRDKLRRNKVVD